MVVEWFFNIRIDGNELNIRRGRVRETRVGIAMPNSETFLLGLSSCFLSSSAEETDYGRRADFINEHKVCIHSGEDFVIHGKLNY